MKSTTKKSVKNNNLVKKFTNADKRIIMSRAHKFLAEIPMNSRTDKTFSDCLRKSWHIAKNGKNTLTFTEIYNKYYNQILYFVNGWVKNMDNAEDITADIFMKFNRLYKDKTYDVYKSKVSTYLHVIAKTMITDYYRTNHSDKFVNVNGFVDEDGNEIFQFTDESNIDVVENDELGNSIEAAINSLKPKYKQIAELYFVKELSYKEICNVLNLPMNNVKVMINRCRIKLQENLKDVRTKTDAI